MPRRRTDSQIVNAKIGTSLGGAMPGGTRDSRKHLVGDGEIPENDVDALDEALLRELIAEVIRLL